MNDWLLFVNLCAAATWFVSGVMWIRAARVKTSQRLTSVAEITQSSFDGSIGAAVQTSDEDNLTASLEQQNQLNRFAALWSCAGALFSAIAAGLNAISN